MISDKTYLLYNRNIKELFHMKNKYDYPRPQLYRESFQSLDGEWLLNQQTIQVPYPPQAPLSCYQGEIGEHLHYQKTFILDDHMLGKEKSIHLHFGAVDQIAKVYINHQCVGEHQGGYLPFWFDITSFIQDGENLLEVQVTDQLSDLYPYGKQKEKSGGMWYTPVSGIWQSVWLEAVQSHYIKDLKITPSLDQIHLHIETTADHYQVSIVADELFLKETFHDKDIDIDIPSSYRHLWTPENPYLYKIFIDTDNDHVESYFALRTVEVKNQDILLNGKPIFIHGVLDQGYFHDGLYLPHQMDEYEKDILRMKELGFNCLRKHIKVEPEAFYFACDQLGMLVIQDHVNNGQYHYIRDTVLPNLGFKYRLDHVRGKQLQKYIFQKHMLDTLKHLYNHPCIIGYTIFNEGWGQIQADDMYQLCQDYDSSRFYDATSGWFHQKLSDVQSEHVYFRNKVLKNKQNRPILLSECGGYTRIVDQHVYSSRHYGYGTTHSEEELTDQMIKMYEEMVLPSIDHGLCGCIYTQLSDIEDEINGLYTYDRQVCKVNKQRLLKLQKQIQKTFEEKKRI